jgi:23S rRNA (guanosine2251-2'-O)-methyltransferase
MGKRKREYIYGINPAFEVIRSGRRRIMQGFISESSARNPRMKKLVSFMESRSIPFEWVEKGRVVDLSESKDNQGVVLKCSTYPYADFEDLLDAPRLLLLDNVEDPHNVGAILRSAEIFGFHSVLLPLKGVPEVYPSVVKVSAGATEFLRIARDRNSNQYARKVLEAGYRVMVLDAKGTVDLKTLQVPAEEKVLLVIGGEDRPVGQFILNEAHDIVSIPQSGSINSLNASVAASIAMFALSSSPSDLQGPENC